MIDWESVDYYERHPDDVVKDIAEALKHGLLGLMVGSGISKKLELPLWHELVVACCKGAAYKSDDIDAMSDGTKLFKRMQAVRTDIGDDRKYLELVSRCLYANWTNPNVSVAPELMRAIGVLVMGSIRGRAKTIINFNFDSLLEWYLSLHGYVVQVIEDVPRGIVDADVHVFHPHGYLPFSSAFGRPSRMILFDQGEAERRATDRNAAWTDVFRFVLGSQVFLAIGLSGNDPMANLMLRAASEQRTSSDKRPLGFWFFQEGSLDSDSLIDLRTKKIVPVPLGSYDLIPNALFDIGRQAAGAVIV